MASSSGKSAMNKPLKSVSVGGKFQFKKKKSTQQAIGLGSGLVSLDVAEKIKVVSNKETVAARSLTKSQEKQRKVVEGREVQKVSQKSYRERIEEFNHTLGTQTEHNDIPRVSAAGNG